MSLDRSKSAYEWAHSYSLASLSERNCAGDVFRDSPPFFARDRTFRLYLTAYLDLWRSSLLPNLSPRCCSRSFPLAAQNALSTRSPWWMLTLRQLFPLEDPSLCLLRSFFMPTLHPNNTLSSLPQNTLFKLVTAMAPNSRCTCKCTWEVHPRTRMRINTLARRL